LVFRTPVSARSYRASAFLLDLLLFCQANKFIQPLSRMHYDTALTQCKLWAIDRSVFKTILTRTGMQKHANHVEFL